jgi:type IV secretory pathway VirB4 component
MGAIAWFAVLLLVVAAVMSDEEIYSLRWLKARGKLGVDKAFRYDFRAKDGIIAFDDNRLIVGWASIGPDFDGSTYAQQAAVIAAHNEALRKRDESWVLDYYDFSESTNGYPAGNKANDPTTATMAWARIKRYLQPFRQFRHDQFITATFTPPSVVLEALNRMMLDEQAQQIEQTDEQYVRALAQFEQYVAELEDALSTVFKLKRLGKRKVNIAGQRRTVDDLVSLLYRIETGDNLQIICERDSDVRRILTSFDFAGGLYPKIDGKYVVVVSIEDTPESSVPGLLDALVSVKVPYCRATKMVFLEQEHARKIARGSYYRQLESSQNLLTRVATNGAEGGMVDPGALENAADAQKALGDITRGQVKYVLWSTRVLLRDKSLLHAIKNAQKIKSEIGKRGFTARVELFNNAEAFVAAMAGDSDHDVSPLALDTIAASDLTRVATNDQGQHEHPSSMYPPGSPPLYRMLTYGGQTYDLVLAQEDVQHTFFAGPTGAGKSTILNTLLAAARAQYGRLQAFVFDQGRSAERYCLASGGDFYALDASDKSPDAIGFAPLLRIDEADEFEWALEWIEQFLLKLQGVTLTPDQQKKLRTCLSIIARLPQGQRTLSTLQYQMIALDRDIASALEHYTITGALGRLLDSDHDSMGVASLQVFEMGMIMKRPDPRIIVPVLEYIFHRIDQRLGAIDPESGYSIPSIVVLDESPEYLKHPAFAERINYWLDKIRKKNGAIWLATLRLGDFMKLPIADAILDSCVNKVFLPNPEADGAMQGLYLDAGCSIEDTFRIADGTKKKHLFVKQGDRFAYCNTDIDPVELVFAGRSQPEDIKQTARLWRQHGRMMGGYLLREAGFDEAADKWFAFARAAGWDRPVAAIEKELLSA